MSEKIPLTFEEGKREDIDFIDRELQKVDLGQLADWIDEYQIRFGAMARLMRAVVFLTPQERETKIEKKEIRKKTR